MMPETEPLSWSDYLKVLGETDDVLNLLSDPTDAVARQEVYRLLFHSIAAGYLTAFLDPDFPDFVPMVNNILNSQGANPDFIYGSARIEGTGSYRLSGSRGDGLFLFFDILAGGIGVMDELGPSVGTLDVDKLTLSRTGAFDVVISADRPAGHTGDWFRLNPKATAITMRQASYDWGAGSEARVAIERLDRPIVPGPAELGDRVERLRRLAAYPKRYASFALEYCKGLHDRCVVNRLEYDDWSGRGGVAGQHYYQGLFRIEPDEALVLETDLPEQVRYWGVQINDPLWNSVDWFNHQSSLNGGQARLDGDGRFRAVISIDDPGMPNWLDTGGNKQGSVMLRLTEASSRPVPSLTLMPKTAVRDYLPAATPIVTPEMRQVSLRLRRRGAQLRRRW